MLLDKSVESRKMDHSKCDHSKQYKKKSFKIHERVDNPKGILKGHPKEISRRNMQDIQKRCKRETFKNV